VPFADGEFDLVYTNKTTHHVRDWRRSVAEMGRVLTPGGQLVYSDFVAPAGRRLPTRRGINSTAEAQGLERTRRGRSPLHYTAYFRKRD
jgi:SAM-dependent methyltransferase